MHDDDAMYGDARMAKLKAVKREIMDKVLALEDENGQIDAGKLQEILDGAGETASEEMAEAAPEAPLEGEGEEVAEEEVVEEEDPLRVAQRKFFKGGAKPERRPGTAVMIAAMQKPKAPASKPGKGKFGKTA